MAEHLSLSFCGCYWPDCPGPSCVGTTPPALFLSKVTTYYGMYSYTCMSPKSTSILTPVTSLQSQSQFFLLNSKLFWMIQRAAYRIHHITEKGLMLASTCRCCIKHVKLITASLIQAMLLSSVHLSTKIIWLTGKMCDLSVSRVPSFPIVPLSSQFWHHWKQRVRLLLKMEWFYATY